MAFTRTSQLTLNENGGIVKGKGFFKKGHTFFYLEDIKKVLEQAGSDAKLSQLQIVNIVFEKYDGPNNHNIHEVTGLALAKSEPNLDGEGNIINTDWHEIVALAWPPYYIRGSVETLENDIPDSPYAGRLFEGSVEYVPGIEIHK